MFHYFSRPVPFTLALAFFTLIPISTALVLVFKIPSSTITRNRSRLAIASFSWLFHALAGIAFGITGSVQFVSAFRHRMEALQHVTGRIYVLSGTLLGLSGISLLAQVTTERAPIVDIARALFGLALLVSLGLAMEAIRTRNLVLRRAWVNRSYAIGIGLGAVSLAFFPIYIITGAPPNSLAADILFLASWALTIVITEVVIRLSSHSHFSGSPRNPLASTSMTQH